jgi:hypothetical protein
VALTSRPVISSEIRLMLSATLLPDWALANVSRTTCAVLPVRCRFSTSKAPTV